VDLDESIEPCVIDEGPDISMQRSNYEEKKGLPIVKYRNYLP